MAKPKTPPPGSMPSMSLNEDAMEAMGNQMSQASGQLPVNSGQQAQQPTAQQQPRDVLSVQQEVVRMGTDLFEAFKDSLGLGRPPKTQEELAQLQQFHQSWQSLDAQQQQAAQMRLQQEMQRKQMMEQEEEMKKAEEAKKQQEEQVVIPQGKRSGQAALDKMMQDRKGMGGASG